MKKVPKNKRFAFWHYYLFPYIVGAEVLQLDCSGLVCELKSYGKVHQFKPSLGFTDLETGEKLKKELEILKINYDYHVNIVKENFNNTLTSIIKGKIKSPFEK